MRSYQDNDYAVNKYSEGIVYRFSDGYVEITLEKYLQEEEAILLEERRNLYLVLSMLDKKDWLLIERLFFDELTEEDLAKNLGMGYIE